MLDGVASLLQSISACSTVAQHFLSQPQWLTLLAALTHSGPLQVQRRGLRVLHRVVPAIRPVHVRRHMHIYKWRALLSFLVWCHHGAYMLAWFSKVVFFSEACAQIC